VPIGVVAAVDGPALVAARFNAEVAAVEAAKTARRRRLRRRPWPTSNSILPLDWICSPRFMSRDFGGEAKFPIR